MKTLGRLGLVLLLWWGAIPVLVGLIWLVCHFLFGGFGAANESWNLFWQNNILNRGGLFWIYGVIGLIGSVIICIAVTRFEKPGRIITALVIGLMVFSMVQFISYNWSADKNQARYYNSATTFYSPSLSNPPTSLQYLLDRSHKDANGCVVNDASDVPNCTRQGTMPARGFDARTSSTEGALLAMQRTSGSTQNVDLLDSTLVYLQGKNAWSAIRDGSGNNAHTEGVVEWKGDGTPSECYFGGKDQFGKAIGGAHTNSLSNVLANAYPTLYWQLSDVYGYCKAGRPVLVFLMRQQTTYLNRTLDAPGGAVIVTGSPNGDPVFKHETNPSNLPGPSYPQSIADNQLQANIWAAGRSNKAHGLFGYTPDEAGDGDFLLRSNADGHTYWVTPLTLTSSKSQLFVAYSMVRADKTTAGRLNPMRIYVLATASVQRINIDSLEASARDYLSQQVPGFFSSGGRLVNFTPTSGDIWRAFAEINGRVVYRLDISASNVIQPVLVSLENFQGTGGGGKAPANANAVCGTPVGSLTQAQIQQCLKQFASALGATAS